jgi:hypothetical protein
MTKFVVSVAGLEDGAEQYYSSTTASNGLLTDDLNAAHLFSSKAEARTVAGRYQALNADSDVSVKQVEVSVSLV